MRVTLSGARVLPAEGELRETRVVVEDGRIVEIAETGAPSSGGCRKGERDIDLRGALLLPGAIDLHGDAFERQIMPRSGVHFSHDLALLDTDRQLLANGVTTAYHGITWSWEPGLRSGQAAKALIESFLAVRSRLACDSRLHLRFETLALEAEEEIAALLRDGSVRLLAFNQHLDLMTRSLDNPDKLSGYLSRTGLSRQAFMELIDEMRGRKSASLACVERLAAVAREAGIPMASHDDDSPATRRFFHGRGVRLSEFPLNAETARAAREFGDSVLLGAPNALRGKSHDKRLAAREAIGLGLCSALTSDYYYPALLHAPFALEKAGVTSFEEGWRLVSTGPAKAAGLNDRGAIAPGLRADLVAVEPANPADMNGGLPVVRLVMVAGKIVWTAP